MRRARLGRYALYQLKDYAIERGLVTLLLIAMNLGPQLYLLRTVPHLAAGRSPDAMARAALADSAVAVATLAVLFAINGISALDRQRGYFRFLFAKPASVPAYYAQDFLVRFVGAVGITSLAVAAFAVLAGASFPLGFVAYVALVFALLGGIGFLLSALVQFDGLVLVLVWIASAMLLQIHDRFPGRVPLVLARALPPVDKFDGARDAWIAGVGTYPAGHLWWVLGYGAACFLAGLVVLRWKPLSR